MGFVKRRVVADSQNGLFDPTYGRNCCVYVDFFIECLPQKLEIHRSQQAFPQKCSQKLSKVSEKQKSQHNYAKALHPAAQQLALPSRRLRKNSWRLAVRVFPWERNRKTRRNVGNVRKCPENMGNKYVTVWSTDRGCESHQLVDGKHIFFESHDLQCWIMWPIGIPTGF